MAFWYFDVLDLKVLGILTVLICGVCIVPKISLYYSRQLIKRRHGCKEPPGPSRSLYDWFGLSYAMQLIALTKNTQRNASLKKSFDMYGPTFVVPRMGNQVYHTIEPRNIQAIMATDFDKWGIKPLRYFAFKPFVGPGIGCLDGQEWARSKSLVRPMFARSNIGDARLAPFSKLVTVMIDSMPKDGSTIDLQTYFGRLSLDSATELLFGEAVGALTTTTKSSQAFLDAYHYGQRWVGKRIFLPQYDILTRDPKFWESCQIARNFVGGYVKAAAAEGAKSKEGSNNIQSVKSADEEPERYVLVREIFRETQDHDEITNEILNVFTPAYETIGIALGNLFFQLARQPEIYQKIRSEVLAVATTFPSPGALRTRDAPGWTFDNLKSLTYLQNAIKESLRLSPTLATAMREALEDTILPTTVGKDKEKDVPIFVPKGSMAIISYHSLHRCQELFGADADRFRPERWDDDNLGLKTSPSSLTWSYMPFGGGPRTCLGQQLTLSEMAFTTVQIVLAFDSIENRDPILEFVEDYKMTTKSKNGVKVSLRPARENT